MPVMSNKWARNYPEYVGYYYNEKPRGKCACCGYTRLIERHMIRNPIRGDVAEIGWICYGYWCKFQGYGLLNARFVAYKAQ